MATRAEKVRLGLFMAIAGLLFAGTLVLLIGPEMWEDQPTYRIRFRQSVSGLDEGSPVKLRGVRVGQVGSVRIDPKDVEVVEVSVELEPDTVVKADHVAIINLQGITGLKYIQLEGGTKEAPELPPGSEIKAGQNMFAQLSGDMTNITGKLDRLLSQLLVLTRSENQEVLDQTLRSVSSATEKLDELLSRTNGLIETTQGILDENRKPLNETIVSLRDTSAHADRTLGEVDASLAEVRGTLRASKVPETTKEIRETAAVARGKIDRLELQQALGQAQKTLASLQYLLDATSETVGQNQESIRLAIENLVRASDNLEEMTRTFQEKPVIQVFGDKPKKRKLP